MNQTLDDAPLDHASGANAACTSALRGMKRIEVGWFVALMALGADFCVVTVADLRYASVLLSGTACVGEFYGKHVSEALGAVDRRVDEARAAQPISGTVLRAQPFEHRRFVDPIVYADLVTKVCFMGAPSTGKSTLARELAARMNTRFMPEYGAEYWLEHHENRRITLGLALRYRHPVCRHLGSERRREEGMVPASHRRRPRPAQAPLLHCAG